MCYSIANTLRRVIGYVVIGGAGGYGGGLRPSAGTRRSRTCVRQMGAGSAKATPSHAVAPVTGVMVRLASSSMPAINLATLATRVSTITSRGGGHTTIVPASRGTPPIIVAVRTHRARRKEKGR